MLKMLDVKTGGPDCTGVPDTVDAECVFHMVGVSDCRLFLFSVSMFPATCV